MGSVQASWRERASVTAGGRGGNRPFDDAAKVAGQVDHGERHLLENRR